MNILYLIGNGFDLAQGMRTKYSDFYDNYSNPPHNLQVNQAALKLRNEISKDYQTWSDLELSLGEYTVQVKSEEIEDVYYDISDALRDYLIEEQNKYKATDRAKDLVITDLINPYSTLLERDRDEVINFIVRNSILPNTGGGINLNVDIITFNYTNTLSQLLSDNIGKVIGENSTSKIFLRDIIHIHGSLDSHMIMGVNDISQIKNNDFKNDFSICDMLVKPESNNAIRSNNDRLCKKLINNANLIVVFGMSLGATDKIWWEAIGERILSKDSKLIIFEHISQPLDYKRAHKLGTMRKNVIDKFTSHLNLHPSQLAAIDENTYVNFSTDFLSLNKDI